MDRTFNTSTFNTKAWNVDQLPSDITLAREQAMLGEYLDSMATYQSLMKKAQQKMATNLSKLELYNKWEEFQFQIEVEMKNVEQMITLADKLETGKVGNILDDQPMNSPGQDEDFGFDGGIMHGGGLKKQNSYQDRPIQKK